MGSIKDWWPGGQSLIRSPAAKDLVHYLESVVILGGWGGISVSYGGPVYVAICHDGSGFVPTGMIAVDQSLYHDLSEDAFSEAYHLLKDRIMEDEEYIEELRKDWGDRWEEILVEPLDGKTWTIQNPAEAIAAIRTDPRAYRAIEIDETGK